MGTKASLPQGAGRRGHRAGTEGTRSRHTGHELQEKKHSRTSCLGGRKKMAQHALLPTVRPLLGRRPALWLFLGAVGCVSPRGRRLCMRLSAELTFQTLRLGCRELRRWGWGQGRSRPTPGQWCPGPKWPRGPGVSSRPAHPGGSCSSH